jgi:hypothetical protein
MAIDTCPSDTVRAHAERIWELVVTPREVARWTGTKLVDAPNPTMRAGDVVVFQKGQGLNIVFKVIALEAPRRLTLDVELPLGVVNREVVEIAPIGDGERCRVTFN